MKELIDDIDRWRAVGKRVAIARVVAVEGSGPRLPGAAMAVSEDGEVAGSVSGGCVEGAVIREAREVMDGAPPRLLEFGVSDEQAWDVGLACGGRVQVWVEAVE